MSYKKKGRQKRQTGNKQAFSTFKYCNNVKSSACLSFIRSLYRTQLRLTTKVLIARQSNTFILSFQASR